MTHMTQPRLDQTLTYRLHLLHKVTDLQSQQSYLSDTGLTMSDGRCLTAVGTFEPMSVNELAHYANLNKGQASRAAQSLVDQGLIRKQDSASDGRGVTLSLTAQGRKVWKRTMDMVHRRNAEIFGCLTKTELKQFDSLLDRLITHNRNT
jgi:DNA-binding MarR family transcriptional regulator